MVDFSFNFVLRKCKSLSGRFSTKNKISLESRQNTILLWKFDLNFLHSYETQSKLRKLDKIWGVSENLKVFWKT